MSAAAWTPTSVTVAGGDGRPAKRDGWIAEAHPAFAITRSDDERYFIVTHVHTGRAIASWFVTRAAAVELIGAIEELTDWERDVEQLRGDAELRARLYAIRASVYEQEADGDFGPVNSRWIRYADLSGHRLEEIQRTPEAGDAIAATRGRKSV